MSLIADLLSKVKKEEHQRDVHPVLKDQVMQSSAQRHLRMRLLIVAVLTGLCVLGGFAAIYIYEDSMSPVPIVARRPVHQMPSQALPAQAAAVSEQTPIKTQEAEVQSPVREGDPAPAIENSTESGKATVLPERKKTVARDKRSRPAGTFKERRKQSQENVSDSAHSKQVPALSKAEKEVSLYQARAYAEQGNYSGATDEYKRVLAANPRNYPIMNNIAGQLLKQGDYAGALNYARNALSIKQNHVPSLINAGIAASSLGNHSEGSRYLERALEIDPANRLILLNMAILYERQGDMEKAEGSYSRLVQRGDGQGYLGLARIAERWKKAETAMGYYREALDSGNLDAKSRSIASDRLMQLAP